ncbi:MAG: hypothetical protein KJ571_01620 [Bacteroidetes bacterium]|nr:hypothetical protein [Bacteroidota bacterium]
MIYTDELISEISQFLQIYLEENEIEFLSAIDSASILDKANILKDNIFVVPGGRFTEVLRRGRKGLIPMVRGAYQSSPGKSWKIFLEKRMPIKFKNEMISIGVRYVK